MPLKLGTKSLKIPYSKGYLGNKLIYQAVQLIPFINCPFPSTWTVVTAGTKYKSTNEYGEWIVNSNGCGAESKASFGAHQTFDRSTSSYWMSPDMSTVSYSENKINCPAGISIKPTSIYFEIGYVSSLIIQGYNIKTQNWENLYTFETSSNFPKKTDTINTENYYSAFRCQGQKMSGRRYNYIYEFQITEGIIKKGAV